MAQAQTQALIKNAQDLGLTWIRRLGTVAGYDGTTPMVIMDGDSVPIGVVSMVGTLYANQRVYVDMVPPSGNYVVGIVDIGWITPTLLNGWANFGGGYQAARYRRLVSGQVEIQGLVAGGTGPPQTIFTLPVGYRPAKALIFATIANAGVVARLDVVGPAGNVNWVAGGTNAYLSLNCTFYPAN
jgi:hypothetical protein